MYTIFVGFEVIFRLYASKQTNNRKPVLCAGLAVHWVDDRHGDIDPWHQARRPPSCKKPVWNKWVWGEGRQRGKWKSRRMKGGGGRGGRGVMCFFYEGRATRSQGAAEGATFIRIKTVMLAVSCRVSIFGHPGCPDPLDPLDPPEPRPSTHI